MSALETPIALPDEPLVPWSPVINKLLDTGHRSASLDDLCAAMLSVSDNSAANLVLQEIGGPRGLTHYLRSIGDSTTRLDRWEPELNEGKANDLRDTTTPQAIGKSLEKLLLGNTLNPASREKLKAWLVGHRIADDLFRSALPEDWYILDRTGAGTNGTRGIVAIFFRPFQGPIVTTLYLRDAQGELKEHNAAFARVGHAIVKQFKTP